MFSEIIIGLCDKPHLLRLKLKSSANLSSAHHGRPGRVSRIRNHRNRPEGKPSITKRSLSEIEPRLILGQIINKTANQIATGKVQNQLGDKPSSATTASHFTTPGSSLVVCELSVRMFTNCDQTAHTNRIICEIIATKELLKVATNT